MPDHLHLLGQLTGELSVSRCVARLKSKTRLLLLEQAIPWQGNVYEHRLRPEEPTDMVIRYIFLNPLRAGLAVIGAAYPWFWLGDDAKSWFMPLADDGRPFPEWLE